MVQLPCSIIHITHCVKSSHKCRNFTHTSKREITTRRPLVSTYSSPVTTESNSGVIDGITSSTAVTSDF